MIKKLNLLIKLHFKNDNLRFIKNKKNIINTLFTILLISILILISIYLFSILNQTFIKLRLLDVYIKFIIFILLIVLLISQTSEIIKKLYLDKNILLYLKLPVDKEIIFLSKILYIYLKQIIISIIYLLITLGTYGYNIGYDFTYYLRIILISIIIPLIPLIISSLISISLSYLTRIIKNNYKLSLVVTIFLVGVIFIIYIRFINVLIDLFGLSGNYIKPEEINKIKKLTINFKISNMFYNILLNEKGFLNFIYVFILILVLIVISYLIIRKFYFIQLSNQQTTSIKNIKNKKNINTPNKAILKREIKINIRNIDISFQSIVLNLLMPLFVLLTVKMTAKAGELTIGKEIIPGITLLTVLIFILISASFQGNLFTNQKDASYIDKILPINNFKLILLRISIGFIINLISLIVTITLLLIFKYLNIKEYFYILLITILFLIGYTLTIVKNDYLKTNNNKIYLTMLISLLIIILIGIGFIIIPYLSKLKIINSYYYLIFIIIVIFGYLINSLLSYKTLKKVIK